VFRVAFALVVWLVVSLVPRVEPAPVFGSSARLATSQNTTIYIPLASVPVAFTPTPVPPTPLPAAAWLVDLNQYRVMAAIPTLAENTAWNTGALHHSRYLVENDTLTHVEDPGNPWYTSDGAQAGAHGDVYGASDPSTPATMAIDAWISAPFHALWILTPGITEVGFGSDSAALPADPFQMAATLQFTDNGFVPAPPGGITYPIPWPGNGSTTPLSTYDGNEEPDPLTSCPGYSAPTGLPITVQFAAPTSGVSSFTVKQNGNQVTACAFDATSYVNPDSNAQSIGRAIMAMDNAVVVIPQQPLQGGATYDVAIVAGGQSARWSFTVDFATSPNVRRGGIAPQIIR
jgi:uncharacterized protein YkwD